MKLKSFVLIVCLFLLVAGNAQAGESVDKAFQRLLALEGTWEGKWEQYPLQIAYQPISGGTAVMETMSFDDGSSMVTVYYKNGDKLMATHYCKMNNQPRLAAQVNAGPVDSLDFMLADGMNLGKTYLSEIHFKFLDENRFEQTNIFHGNDHKPQVVYTRKK